MYTSKLEPSESVQVHLGSRWGNRYVHIFQVVFVLLMLVLFGVPTTPSAWLFAVLIVAFEFYLASTVYCVANEHGLQYQRWSHWNRIAWRDIGIPKRQPFSFYKCIAIRNRPFWKRYLLLPAGPSLHMIEIESAEDRAVRDLLQDGFTGRTN